MKTSIKLSTVALVASGLFLSTTAMAATINKPTIKADNFTMSSTAQNSGFDISANDDLNGFDGTYKCGRASYGSVSVTEEGVLTYTPSAKAKGKKLDNVSCTFTYTDAKGKTRKVAKRVRLNLKANAATTPE